MAVGKITQGGQTWAHSIRMLNQVMRLQLMVTIASGLLYFAYAMTQEPKTNFQAAYYYCRATLPLSPEKIKIDGNFWNTIANQKGKKTKRLIDKQAIKKMCKPKALLLKNQTKKYLKRSGYISLATFFLTPLFFSIRGVREKKNKHLGGIRMDPTWKTKLKMRLLLKRSDIKLGSIPLLKNSETKHMLICGMTGTGKTTALRQLLHQIRKRGDRAVVVDTTGEFFEQFFKKEKDILLNPYDLHSSKWHPWCECTQEYDFERLVNSLIPQNEIHYEDFFTKAARAVILAYLLEYKRRKETKIKEFVKNLLKSSTEEIYQELKETKARIYVDPKGEKTTMSIRATIANYIRRFDALENTNSPFSIRDWVLSDADSWLFLSYETSQREALNPLVTLWFSIATHALKERSQHQAQKKIWLIIDELHSLQKIEYLEESLAELRKYGGAIVLATQNVSQLDKIYGQHGSRIILDQCGTKVSFRQSDSEIAKRMSSFFGQRDIREKQEGLSYGAHQMRDGVTLSSVNRTKATISLSQIMGLPDLQAFVKLPGNWPPMRAKFRFSTNK